MNLLTHRSQCNYCPLATHQPYVQFSAHDSLTNYSKSNGPRVVIASVEWTEDYYCQLFITYCRNILLLHYHICSASILSLQLIIFHCILLYSKLYSDQKTVVKELFHNNPLYFLKQVGFLVRAILKNSQAQNTCQHGMKNSKLQYC